MKNQLNKFLLGTIGYELRKPLPVEFSDLRWRGLDTAFHVLNAINSTEGLDDYQSFYNYVKSYKGICLSQSYQDLFVMWALHGKTNGYFVEFGADDGLLNSNSYIFELEMNWNGLLIEPNPYIFEKLKMNRRVKTLNLAVTSSDSVNDPFIVREDRQHSGFFNTSTASPNDPKTKEIAVEAKTLNTILEEVHAPKYFDLLSIDVEGHEEDVLKGFKIDEWYPKIVIIEHNNDPKLKKYIYNYFLNKNYSLKLPAFSFHDYWFVYNG